MIAVFASFTQEEPISEEFRQAFNKTYLDLGGVGERVLG